MKLYNSLSRKKEEFQAITPRTPLVRGDKNKVGVYTCGPTVYDFAHIGNLRSYVFADLLTRALKYDGFKVKWVMNITDVEDKTIKGAKEKYPALPEMEALKKFTAEYEKYFWADLAKLNVNKPDVITHATAYIGQMQELIANIYKKGFAYIKDGSVYFDVGEYSKKHKYGCLVDLDAANLKATGRVDADEYEKENIQDFALWKGVKEGEPFWDFKLDGQNLPGRPGWHIECSAMSKTELDCPFDIHTGGVDLKFPHHENEIHQSVVGYGANKPVDFWLHNEHLLVDGQRMGKRFKNFYTIKDLEDKGFNPLAFRFLCLQTHYGKPINFTWEALEAAEEGLKHLYNQLKEAAGIKYIVSSINADFKKKFLEAINDDLNLPRALAVAQETLKADLAGDEKLATILDFDKVLGLKLENALKPEELPENIKELAAQREKARAEKDFKKSDDLRGQIEELGYIVEDTKGGQRISGFPPSRE